VKIGKRLEGHSVPLHRDLIKQAQRGDSYAQYSLYKLYHKAMYNVSLRITTEPMDAEDALQDAFVSAFQHMNQYREEASFGAWLKRIVINKSLSLIKKRDKWDFEEELNEENYEPYEWEDLPERELQIESIKNGIKKLPDGFRMVLTLYLLEGYDHSEIAEILGISVSTSKSQYNRAKKKLREMLYQEVKYG
jgi:RNA polymerase sigma factor (sigma-70 family)